MTHMEFEKNECQRCTRICYVCVLGSCKLCDACLTIMSNDYETKQVMKALLETYGIPKLEHDHGSN